MNELDHLEKTPEPLSNISEAAKVAQQLASLHDEWEAAQVVADQLKKRYDEFCHVTVPNVLAMMGLTGLLLEDGRSIEVVTKYYMTPNRNQEDKRIICDWLKEKGGDAMVQEEYRVQRDKTARQVLLDHGIAFDEILDFNTNKVKSWLKDQLGIDGGVAQFEIDDIPKQMHFIQQQEAVIKN